MSDDPPLVVQGRADAIRRDAIDVFAAQGYRGTSMADIASAAGVSRQTVYQYFDNRAAVFRAAFQALLEDATDAALQALESETALEERLDGYLQRYKGDGYERLASTPFGAELNDARLEFAADIADVAFSRARSGLRDFVHTSTSLTEEQRESAIDLLILGPTGLGGDNPTPAAYRRRLTALATAAAMLIEPA